MSNPAAGRQLPDLAVIQRRLRVEVEAVEFAHKRELRDLACHGDAPLVAPRDLARNEEGQSLAQGHLQTRRFAQQRIELIPDRGQLQPVELSHQHLVIDRRHHQLLIFGQWPRQSGRRNNIRRSYRRSSADYAGKMRALDNALATSPAQGMIRHHLARMTHDNAAAQHHDLDALPDQPPGNRVTVRVQVDSAVRLDLAHEIPQLPKRRPSAQRAKRPGLFGKPLRRSHAGRAMHTLIGNLARPPVQMRLERRPVLEPAAGNRIALDVADPRSSFPFVRAR